MRNVLLTLLSILSMAAAGQIPGNVIERSPDGKYLRIQNRVMYSSKGAARDLTIYNFETDTKETIKQVSAYGGYSPNHSYLAYSKHTKDRNKHVYKNELLSLNTGRKSYFSDDHLVLKVFDNGKILSTKPSFNKYGNVKSQSGLYVLEPKNGEKITILGKKEDLKNYLGFNHQFTNNLKYSLKLQGDDLAIHDLETGDARSHTINWPDVARLGNKRLIEAHEVGSIFRVSDTKDGESIWFDFYYVFEAKSLLPMKDHTQIKTRPAYGLINGKIYEIDPGQKKVTKYSAESAGLVEETYWTFSSADYRRDIKDYDFALVSEDRLAVIHFTDGLMQVVDLANDRLIKEVSLFKTMPITTVSASKPKASEKLQKKVYNNVFLNSFDPLQLSYRLDYNTIRGREVTRPNGQDVSAIGLLGNTTDGSPIVLMMRRYNAQGAEIINFEVAVYDEQANLKSSKAVGFTSRDRSGVPNKVDFVINRKGQSVVFEVNQKEGSSNRKYQVIINQAGTITRTQ